MPKINEMLLKLEGFHYAMSIDLNMGYYHIRLRKNVSNLCTIIPPWGKYCYNCLPTGVANSPENFQQKMNDFFHGFKFIRAYIYDILILKRRYWKNHVHKLELMPNKLKEKSVKYNIENYFFGQTEMEYLGFWVTRDGVKPINRKIEEINNMKPHNSQK